MNWQAISFDWNQIRAFLATAEEGSLSGAARVLNTTQPTVGRQISSLEEKLGVTLVERDIRGMSLTQTGRELLVHVRSMGEAATFVSMLADAQSQQVSGEVTVTATDLLSAISLPDILAPLRDTAPQVRIRIVASADIQNLMQRDADIAIRHIRPDQPDLIARHVGDFRASLYASSGYLDRIGRPRTPQDISGHAFVGPLDHTGLLATLQNQGMPFREENFVMCSDSGVVVWEMLRAGFGISMLPEALCDPEPGLEKVLPDLPPIEFPIWLVTHRELQTSRKIRVVFDRLAEGLREASRRTSASSTARAETKA